MRLLSIIAFSILLTGAHQDIAVAAPKRLSAAEVKALLATSPVFEERGAQTVQYTLYSDGSASAFARWFFWTFSMKGTWRTEGEIVCVFLKPEDEEGSEMCATFTHLEKNRYRVDEDDGEQTEVFLITSVNDGRGE